MRIDDSKDALCDLNTILNFLAREWPGVGAKFDSPLNEIERRIFAFPKGAVAAEGRPGVFANPFVKLPYRLFYTIQGEAVLFLHIRNASLAPWKG